MKLSFNTLPLPRIHIYGSISATICVLCQLKFWTCRLWSDQLIRIEFDSEMKLYKSWSDHHQPNSFPPLSDKIAIKARKWKHGMLLPAGILVALLMNLTGLLFVVLLIKEHHLFDCSSKGKYVPEDDRCWKQQIESYVFSSL